MRDVTSNMGTVIELEGEFAVVLRERLNPCVLCPGEDECTETDRDDCSIEIRALNELGAKVGDAVSMALTDESQVMRAIFYVYGVPMAFLMSGLLGGVATAQVVGYPMMVQSAIGVVLGMVALGASLPVSRRLDRWALETGRFTPVITDVDPKAIEV